MKYTTRANDYYGIPNPCRRTNDTPNEQTALTICHAGKTRKTTMFLHQPSIYTSRNHNRTAVEPLPAVSQASNQRPPRPPSPKTHEINILGGAGGFEVIWHPPRESEALRLPQDSLDRNVAPGEGQQKRRLRWSRREGWRCRRRPGLASERRRRCWPCRLGLRRVLLLILVFRCRCRRRRAGAVVGVLAVAVLSCSQPENVDHGAQQRADPFFLVWWYVSSRNFCQTCERVKTGRVGTARYLFFIQSSFASKTSNHK